MNSGHGTSRHSVGGDHIDIEWMGPSAFMLREQKTLLGRLYQQWIECGETTETGFLLSYEAYFHPWKTVSGSEERLIIRIETPGGTPPLASIDETAIIGRDHPFGMYTHSAVFKCLTERDIVYMRVSLELSQLHLNFMRLLLPVVNSSDEITAVYMVHRFMGEPFQVIESDPFTWVPA